MTFRIKVVFDLRSIASLKASTSSAVEAQPLDEKGIPPSQCPFESRFGYLVDTRLTTPWIGWAPKCPTAGPVYTRVKLAN